MDSEFVQISEELRTEIAPYADNNRVIPFETKRNILGALGHYRKSELITFERDIDGRVIGGPSLPGELVSVCEQGYSRKPVFPKRAPYLSL